jgi:hypothetical protein
MLSSPCPSANRTCPQLDADLQARQPARKRAARGLLGQYVQHFEEQVRNNASDIPAVLLDRWSLQLRSNLKQTLRSCHVKEQKAGWGCIVEKGVIQQGFWGENEMLEGFGIDLRSDGLFWGNFEHGKYSGEGTFVWPCGMIYKGGMTSSARQFEGRIDFVGGGSFEGTWMLVDDWNSRGFGTLTLADGSTIEDANARTIMEEWTPDPSCNQPLMIFFSEHTKKKYAVCHLDGRLEDTDVVRLVNNLGTVFYKNKRTQE